MPPTIKPSNSNSQTAPAAGSRSIRDFFRPFTIPKHRIPANDVIEDEIVVAPARTPRVKNAADSVPSAKTSVAGSRTTGRDALAREKDGNGNVESVSRSRKLSVEESSGQLDSTSDHDDTSAPSVRRLVAVEIQSPPKARQLAGTEERSIPSAPQLDPALRPSSQKPAVNTSFSSISTLSSVPRSSQSSSRRVIRDGWQAVTNSDSGSDSGADDSDDLLDMADLIPRVAKRRKVSPVPEEEAPLKLLDGRHCAARQRSRLPATPPTPPRPVYKHSLAALAAQAQQRETVDAKLAAAEEAFEAAQRRRDEHVVRANGLDAALELTVEDDSDEGQRMKLAMQRTEALLEDERFLYFRGPSRIDRLPKPRDWPFDWLGDPQKWEQACLSGFVAEVVGRRPVSQDACRWMLAELLIGDTSDQLRAAYVDVLCQCCERGWYDGLRSLSDCYALADVGSQFVAPARKVMEAGSGCFATQLAPKLKYILPILKATCSIASPDDVALCTGELMLANIDENVMTDSGLRVDVQDTVEEIVANRSNDDFVQLSARVVDRFRQLNTLSLEMRCRAISALPATTGRSHELRRRLALQLIISQKPAKHTTTAASAALQLSNAVGDFDILLAAVQRNPHFAISEGTNYSLLASLTMVLDVAIDAGFGRPHPTEASPSVHPSGNVSLPTPRPASLLATMPSTTLAPTPAERAFNRAVDALAAHLRALASRVRDAGSAHLRRTEAKTALERLAARLECGVRTRPRARAAVFGRGLAPQRELLAGFVSGSGSGRGSGTGTGETKADATGEGSA